MYCKIVEAIRSVPGSACVTRWKPFDVVCLIDGKEKVVRIKPAVDENSTAVAVAESVSHKLLSLLGFVMAPCYAVRISRKFADDLTNLYNLDTPVREGLHWGTLFQNAVEVASMLQCYRDRKLHNPEHLFRLYLADVVIANSDRKVLGNALLTKHERTTLIDIIPIDQSDAFFHPATLRNAESLREKRNKPCGQWLDGTEQVVASKDNAFVHSTFRMISNLLASVDSFIEASQDEWYDRAAVNPDAVRDTLAYRIENVNTLANKDRWLEMPQAMIGGILLEHRKQ